MKNSRAPRASADPGRRNRTSETERRLDGSPVPGLAKAHQRIGVAADHGGYELMQYLAARFSGAERRIRRLCKVAELENRLPPAETTTHFNL